jgi:hypothetical protein
MLVQTKRQRNVDLTATIYFHCGETLVDVGLGKTWTEESNFDTSLPPIAIHLKYNRAVIPDQEIYRRSRFISSYKTGTDAPDKILV